MRLLRCNVLALVVVALLVLLSLVPTGRGNPTVGGWSAPFLMPVVGIHAALTPTNQVLVFSKPESAEGSEAWLLDAFDPIGGQRVNVSQDYLRDIFCAGHSWLPDGRLYITGGHVKGTPNAEKLGVKETDLFDPGLRTWQRSALMAEDRWYPTNVPLGDGDVLIFGGEHGSSAAQVVERFDSATGTLTPAPASANKELGSYPRMFVAPGGRIAKVGPARGAHWYDPMASSWSWLGNMKYGSRNNGAFVVLPGDGSKVLAIGGRDGTNGVTATAEILDLSARKPAWRYTGSLTYARHHLNAVLLPDGKVLAVGGTQGGSFSGPFMKTAEIFDPATETWTLAAAQEAPRAYHATSLLLPDGRVLSAGMDSGSYQRYGEIYSPPYLFKGPRPVISGAPAAIAYGERFTISSPQAGGISRVALIRPGSVTHSMDFDQRYLDLAFTTGDGSVSATAPTNRNAAVPGYYMLFIVDGDGVPSVAAWVQLK